MRNTKIILYLVMAWLATAPAYAFDTTPYRKELNQVINYLQGFNTLQARFHSMGNRPEDIGKGHLYIQRPGNARLQYVYPDKTIMVINEGRISYYDAELDQIMFADLPPSPLNILLYGDVDFETKNTITDIRSDAQSFRMMITPNVTTEQEEALRYVTIALIFQKNPLQLIRLQYTSPNNETTSIALTNLELDVAMDEELFIFRNPKFNRRRKN